MMKHSVIKFEILKTPKKHIPFYKPKDPFQILMLILYKIPPQNVQRQRVKTAYWYLRSS